jgi:adenylate kinase
MNIILTGHTGVKKKKVAESLISEFAKQKSLPTESIMRFIKYYNVEESVEMNPFLITSNDRRRKQMWRDAFNAVIRNLERDRPEHALIGLHLTFQRESRFFSPLGWSWRLYGEKAEEEDGFDIIQKLNPEYFVTLIDDVYCVWSRIARGSYFRLRELTAWRAIEISMTDLVAGKIAPRSYDVDRYPYERSPVVAIKHPPIMLYRFLFEPRKLRVYASFPITRTRNDKARRSDIDEFRKSLHDNFTVFDPLTIDEKPLEFLLKQYQEEHPNANLYETSIGFHILNRWPIPPQFALYSDSQDYLIKGLNAAEIDEISRPAEVLRGGKSEIDRNIRLRDFRLIDQADCLVAYRPQYKNGIPSGGMTEEIRYAVEIALKPVFIVHNSEEDGQFSKPLSPELSEVYGDISELVQALKEFEEKGDYINFRRCR